MNTTLLILNIFTIVVWIPLLVILLRAPKERTMKNSIVSLIVFVIIFIKVCDIIVLLVK